MDLGIKWHCDCDSVWCCDTTTPWNRKMLTPCHQNRMTPQEDDTIMTHHDLPDSHQVRASTQGASLHPPPRLLQPLVKLCSSSLLIRSCPLLLPPALLRPCTAPAPALLLLTPVSLPLLLPGSLQGRKGCQPLILICWRTVYLNSEHALWQSDCLLGLI